MVSFKSFLETFNYMTIGVVGPVSSGKTSLMSMIRNQPSGSTAKKRATMSTTVFRETDSFDKAKHDEQIENIKCMDKTLCDKDDDNKALQANLEHAFEQNIISTPPIDLFDCYKNTKVQLVDIPGLNDSSTKELYYSHLQNIFSHFSVILLIFDINSAMNTDDEMQILREVVGLAKQANESTGLEQKLFIIANKCDEMTYDVDENMLTFTDDEDKELYEQLSTKVEDVVEALYPELEHGIVRISAENSFFYNTCSRNIAEGRTTTQGLEKKYKDKLGVSELGRKWHRLTEEQKDAELKETLTPANIQRALYDSGYTVFQQQIAEHLTPCKQFVYLLNNLRVCLKQEVSSVNPVEVYNTLADYVEVYNTIADVKEYEMSDTNGFISRLLEVCKRYDMLVNDFGTHASEALKEFSFEHLLQPLFEGLGSLMQNDIGTLSNFEKNAIVDGKPPNAVIRSEIKLYNFLCNWRKLIQEANRIRRQYRNDSCGISEDENSDSESDSDCNVFGLFSMTNVVTGVLLMYYEKFVYCENAAHAYVNDTISKVLVVDSEHEIRNMVLNFLTTNNTLTNIAATDPSIVADSNAVKSYLSHYHRNSIISDEERNEIVADIIVKRYDNLNVSSIARSHHRSHRSGETPYPISPAVGSYIITADRFWGRLTQEGDIYDTNHIFKQFHRHINLCSTLKQAVHHLQRWDIRDLYTGSTDLSTWEWVDFEDTLEFTCAKWCFPNVFQPSRKRRSLLNLNSDDTSTARVTRSKHR